MYCIHHGANTAVLQALACIFIGKLSLHLWLFSTTCTSSLHVLHRHTGTLLRKLSSITRALWHLSLCREGSLLCHLSCKSHRLAMPVPAVCSYVLTKGLQHGTVPPLNLSPVCLHCSLAQRDAIATCGCLTSEDLAKTASFFRGYLDTFIRCGGCSSSTALFRDGLVACAAPLGRLSWHAS
jgi:hypothetical protein